MSLNRKKFIPGFELGTGSSLFWVGQLASSLLLLQLPGLDKNLAGAEGDAELGQVVGGHDVELEKVELDCFFVVLACH